MLSYGPSSPVTFQGPLGAASAQYAPVLRGGAAPVTFQGAGPVTFQGAGPLNGMGTVIGAGLGLGLLGLGLTFGINYLAFRVGGMKHPAKASGVLLAGNVITGGIMLGIAAAAGAGALAARQ